MGNNSSEESYLMNPPKVNSVRHNKKIYGAILLSIFLILCVLIVLHYLDMQLSQDALSKTSIPVQEIVTDDIPKNVIHNLNPAQKAEDQTRRPSWRISPSPIVVSGKHYYRRSPYISVGRSNPAANHPLQRPDVKPPGQHKGWNGTPQTNEHDEELQHLLTFMVQMAGVFLVVSVGIYFGCKMEKDQSKLGKWFRSYPNVYQKAHCAACYKI